MGNNDEKASKDETDGFGCLWCLCDSTDKRSHINCSKPPTKVTVKVAAGKEDLYYKLDHKNRGIAVILNHENFLQPQLKVRSGTNEDERNLKKTFGSLGFSVYSFYDLTTKELFEEVDRFAAMDHSDFDCFVMCILTHGDDGCLYSKNTQYRHDDIFSRFTADHCKTLAGKPKLFFIQACQGDRLDPGVRVTSTDAIGGSNYTMPIYADFLVAYSTMPGFFSWRNTTNGSWFVQALCSVLQEYTYDFDLLTLLTIVNRRVAFDFESNTPGNKLMHAQKQIPFVTFMLTRLFKFTDPRLKSIAGSSN